MRARYYDPAAGRFLSRDTWAYNHQDPRELNRYAYVAGNPLNWTDPSGHAAATDSLGVYGGIGRSVGPLGQLGQRIYTGIARGAVWIAQNWRYILSIIRGIVTRAWIEYLQYEFGFDSTVYRVQTRGEKGSQERIMLDATNSIYIVKKQQMLYIFLDADGYAAALVYFHRPSNLVYAPDSYIIAFDIPWEMSAAIRLAYVAQEVGKLAENKGNPQAADHHQNNESGYGLPTGWIIALELSQKRGSGRIVYP